MPLETKLERFAQALLTESSQSAALRKSHSPAAKWPSKKVHDRASAWANRPDVRGRVAELQAAVAREVVLESAEIIRSISALALSDIRGIVSEKGQIRLPHELDKATAAAISKFKMSVDGTIEYQFHSKTTALDQACKILVLYAQDNKQKSDPVVSLLEFLMERTGGSSRLPIAD